MDEQIRKILQKAIMAPSGDNCQPWLFKAVGDTVELYNDPQLDTSLYNIKQRASLVAHGAALENICLAAPAEGLQARISLYPDQANSDHIASISFSKEEEGLSPLFTQIPQRHTNRERYQSVNISDTQIECWQGLAECNEGKVWVARETEQLKTLSDLLSLNDRLVFEVADLHRFLFEQIRWSDVQARQSADGLDIKTLGLNAIDRFSFRFLQSFTLVSVLNKVGFSRIVQIKAKHLLRSSSAFVFVSAPGTEPVDYIYAGRLWQRFLLQLTAAGLSAQPVAGLACLMQSQHEGLLDEVLSVKQRDNMEYTRSVMLEMAEIPAGHTIVGIFRIGKGPEVVRALRRPLETFIL